MPTARDPSLGLVLSGGGARGAFDAGVVEAVDEAGLRPGVVSGTSAGALTGAALACGWGPARITELWTSLQTRHVLRPRLDLHRLVRWRPLLQPPHHLLGFGAGSTSETLLDLVGWTWLFHLRPLRGLLVDELGGERLPLEDDVTLALPAIDVDTGRLVRFSNRPLPAEERDGTANLVVDLTVDHVLASAAIPGLFEPIEIDGSTYWDGGLTSNTPLTAAIAHDVERLLVAGSSTEEPGTTPPQSLGDVLALALDHVLRGELLEEVDHARTVSELAALDSEATYHQPVELLTVLPQEPIRGIGDLLDFEPEVARALVTSGRRATRQRLQDAAWN